MFLYSMPSAWADVKIWREGNNGGITFGLGDSNAPITIADATLQISYYRTLRSDNPTRRRDLEVKVRWWTMSCLLENCLWRDVPGTEGQSNYLVPPSGLPSFFRLMRVR